MNLIDREASKLPKEEYRILDFMKDDEMISICEAMLEKDGTAEKLKTANLVGDVVINTLKEKKLINDYAHQTFVDVMLAAALLHNVYYDKSEWTTLFSARRAMDDIEEAKKAHQQSKEALCSTIEAQLGESTPVRECAPKPGTPTEMFSTAVWFVNTYLV